MGIGGPAQIDGLELAARVDVRGGTKTILGFPAARGGDMVTREGLLAVDDYPTDDTSNFGPLSKFKLEDSTSWCL